MKRCLVPVTKSLGKIHYYGHKSQIFGFYCVFITKYFTKQGKIRKIREKSGKIREKSGFFCKKPPDEALFGARDEKFGQNPLYGHRSQIFGFYCIFITKYFTKQGKIREIREKSGKIPDFFVKNRQMKRSFCKYLALFGWWCP